MNIDEILQKHFLNEDSKEELEILNAWKAESADNLVAFKEMQSHLKQFEILKDYKQYDTDTAWDSLTNKIDAEQNPSIFSPFVLKIAAAILLLVAALFVFNQDKDITPEIKTLVSQETKINEVLADQSVVYLNQHSEIDITDFTAQSRTLTLNKGEAYFEVEADKSNPFVVQMGKYNVEVVGTEFNLVRNGQNINLSVFEGSVRFSNGTRTVEVGAGQQLIADDSSFSKARASISNVFSWKTGELVFENIRLNDALKDLSKFYNTQIKISPQSAEAGNCILNTRFSDENLEEMLLELKSVYGMEYQQTDQLIVITKTDC